MIGGSLIIIIIIMDKDKSRLLSLGIAALVGSLAGAAIHLYRRH